MEEGRRGNRKARGNWERDKKEKREWVKERNEGKEKAVIDKE